MQSKTRKCKICGCEYQYCKTAAQNRFRYQDVACSPEHAEEYFRRIELSRMNDAAEVKCDGVIDSVDDSIDTENSVSAAEAGADSDSD